MAGEVFDYEKLLETLESQELDAPNGVPPDCVYERLLAIYYLKDDILSAKMLWHRIPKSVKQKCPQLEKLWTVGRHLFLRERAMVFQAVDNQEWSPTVATIIQDFKVSYREKLIELISKAYTSIGVEDVAKLLGLNEQEVIQKIELLGWKIDLKNQMVTPSPPKKEKPRAMPSEKQLERLTKYVSFLEIGL